MTTDDGWYGTINLSNLYEQHHDEELTIDDAIDAAANEFFFNARIVNPVVYEGSCVDYFSLEKLLQVKLRPDEWKWKISDVFLNILIGRITIWM